VCCTVSINGESQDSQDKEVRLECKEKTNKKIPGGGGVIFFAPVSGYRVSFLGVKRPGRGVNHPPPSNAEVKERVELYLYSSSGSS
jgi:hypothetical protein